MFSFSLRFCSSFSRYIFGRFLSPIAGMTYVMISSLFFFLLCLHFNFKLSVTKQTAYINFKWCKVFVVFLLSLITMFATDEYHVQIWFMGLKPEAKSHPGTSAFQTAAVDA